MSNNYQYIIVKPIGGRIGAETTGVDLSSDLSDAVVVQIHGITILPSLKLILKR